MSNKRKTELTERQARLAEVKADQRKAERKRNTIIGVVVGVVVLGLVGTTIAVVAGENAKNAELEAQADKPIDGVETFADLPRDHVTNKVDYAQNPPVGGEHAEVGQICGFYSAPIGDENAVHSLEHGAVWITHDPDLPADQVATLREAADKESYLLVSPRTGLAAPVVASAWGVQLPLDSADDARLPVFISAYVNGPQTPEPGASCSVGLGTPE